MSGACWEVSWNELMLGVFGTHVYMYIYLLDTIL